MAVQTYAVGKHELSRLVKGDVITQIDGRAVGPFTVAKRPTDDGIIRCEPNGRPVDVNIYAVTNIERNLTVRHTTRPVTRTVDGRKWTRDENGEWVSPSGRYVVAYTEVGFTECDNPHPYRDGGYCPGMQPHVYSAWSIWDRVTDDFARPNWGTAYDSFKDAIESAPND